MTDRLRQDKKEASNPVIYRVYRYYGITTVLCQINVMFLSCGHVCVHIFQSESKDNLLPLMNDLFYLISNDTDTQHTWF